MWPPDPDPDPDPDPQAESGSRAGAALPALRALLPPRAFLCSRKGRLLLAESVRPLLHHLNLLRGVLGVRLLHSATAGVPAGPLLPLCRCHAAERQVAGPVLAHDGFPALRHGGPHLLRHLHHSRRQILRWGIQSSGGVWFLCHHRVCHRLLPDLQRRGQIPQTRGLCGRDHSPQGGRREFRLGLRLRPSRLRPAAGSVAGGGHGVGGRLRPLQVQLEQASCSLDVLP